MPRVFPLLYRVITKEWKEQKKTRGVNSADADQLFEGFLKIRVHCVNSRTTNIHRLLFFSVSEYRAGESSHFGMEFIDLSHSSLR